MNWTTFVGLTVGLLVIAFARLRVEARRQALVNGLLVIPTAILLFFYAWFYNQWLTVGAALALAMAIAVVWWIVYGSYLPAPTSDNISVWGQEIKKPSPAETAALEAEVKRLNEEKRKMEEEIKRLKGARGGDEAQE